MKKIRLGIINSNYVKIGPYTKKGTEIFDYIFTTNLVKRYSKEISVTSFCSGNSLLPTRKISVGYKSSHENPDIGLSRAALFESALISRAIKMSGQFDIFHVNMGIGEQILPFAQLTKKPFVITAHGPAGDRYMAQYFSLFRDLKNLNIVTISNSQRKYTVLSRSKTIYHGIDTKKRFLFNKEGGKKIIWTGRAVPEKGLDEVLMISKKLKIPTKVFPIIKSEYMEWLYKEVLEKRDIINQITKIDIDFNSPRNKLVHEYQTSKVFLFPVRWEEPFGFTVVESMACGTPVISYAKGSIVELIKDGETGFLVNSSKEDIRGNYIVKKTGFEGLCDAVKRIYDMPKEEYEQMRQKTREHAAKNFEVDRMVDEYVALYKEILGRRWNSF